MTASTTTPSVARRLSPRVAPRFAAALGALLALGLASQADADPVLRYTTTQPGGIVATGNALGLSKALDANGPGTEDSIGTFMCLDPNSVDDVPANAGNPWPAGTTNDWTANGSTAVLDLPPGAEILYAELVWGGSDYYWDTNGPEDVRPYTDDPVVLDFNGTTTDVTPDQITALDIADPGPPFDANYYIRSGEVTAFVAQHGAGTYAISGVPATQSTAIDDLNAAGWSLVVAFRHEDLPIRNLSVFVGGSWVDENTQQDYTVTGFCAPPFGAVEGNIVVSALEGDADRVGDLLAIAPTVNDTFVTLSGPNNPADNFFCSQINGADGLLDTQGSFGSANHDAIGGTNVSGGRQSWDVTTVAVSSADGHLFNDQESAVVRTDTTGDSYVPALVALEMDVKSPDFTDGSTTTASQDPVSLGDAFTVTARLNNTGEALANDLVLHMTLDPGLDLTGFTLDGNPGDFNGNPVTADILGGIGVAVGALDINTALEVVLSLQVSAAPANGTSFLFVPEWDHRFLMCDAGDYLTDTHTSEHEQVAYQATGGTGGTGGIGGTGGSGATGNTGGAGATTPGVGDDPEDEGSCGCRMPGHSDQSGWLGRIALLALAGSMLRRRRR